MRQRHGQQGRFRIGRIAVALAAFAGASLAASPLPAGAITGSYRIALIQVSYSDSTTHIVPYANLQQAAPEIQSYFDAMSNGTFALTIDTYQVTLANPVSAYWATPPSRDLATDALTASGATLSSLNGVVVLSSLPDQGDFTEGAPRTVTIGGTTRQIQISYDFEACPLACRAPWFTPGPAHVYWNGWAHEIGHQLELAGGTMLGGVWNGHPSGYSSGYDLMDSGYPNSESVYGLWNPDVGVKKAFPGWLPSSKVQTVAAPTSGGTVTTGYDLAPIAEPSASTGNLQGLKLPIERGVYITVEARRRVGADALSVGPGIWDQGVALHFVRELNDPPVATIDSCDYVGSGGCVRSQSDPRASTCPTGNGGRKLELSHRYCWPYALFHVGDAFNDTADNLTVHVDSYNSTTNSYHVSVTRGMIGGTPDVSITPWQTAPLNTWETKDIWVDSSCNGYGIYKYGTYPSPNDTVGRGNGDDPCINHENRVWARVTNLGNAPAQHVVVNFARSDPMGTGVGPSTGWVGLGSVNEVQFPQLSSIPPGGHVDVSLAWTPSVDPATLPDATTFSFHTCLQVSANAVPGELLTGNNSAQENFEYWQDQVTTGGAAPVDAVAGAKTTIVRSIYLRNESAKGDSHVRDFRIYNTSHLPAGSKVTIAGGASVVALNPGQVMTVPVKVVLPSNLPLGQLYNINVMVGTTVTDTNPAIRAGSFASPTHTEGTIVGGVVIDIDTVAPTAIKAQGTQTADGTISAQGSLASPAPAGQLVTLDYIDGAGTVTSHLVKVQADGSFTDTLAAGPNEVGKWQLRSIWAGTTSASSAVSAPSSVPVV